MSDKTLIVYSQDGNEVVIDNAPEQIASWEKAGYSTVNPANVPSKPNDFEPIVMVKGDEEKAVDSQKAYNKAIKEGWVVKENEN